MLVYLVRRLLYAIPILIGVSVLTFLLFYAVTPPRSLARRNLTTRNPSDQEIKDWLRQHGYDKPLMEQAKKHIGEMLLLKFGKSDVNDEDIWKKIRQGVGPSLSVAIPEFIVSVWITITLALVVAYFRGTYIDVGSVGVCIFLMSVNYVVWIITAQFLFAKELRIFPIAGFAPSWTAMKFVVLPALVGVISGLGGSVLFYRSAFLEEMDQDYVRTARSRGIPERQVLFKHVLKNAASPIITTVVLSIPFLFLGSILLESFFGIPGLGSMTLDAINSSDFAIVRAMVFLGTVAYIIGNIMTDICYALVNPRVRLE